jgi:hypothetical protein
VAGPGFNATAHHTGLSGKMAGPVAGQPSGRAYQRTNRTY